METSVDHKAADEPHLDLYTIPSHSRWFSWADIHETERAHLGEFFDGSSVTRSPKIYKEYRDFIISKYRECPLRRLSFTEARKSLVGDVSVLHKVFRFLDSHGLINFGAVTDTDGTSTLAAEEGEEREGEWDIRVEEGLPIGVRVVAVPNGKAAVLTVPPGGRGGRVVENGSLLPPLASYRDVYGDMEEVCCKDCKQRCDSAHYHCEKEGGFRICVKCFKNEKHGKDYCVDDFKLVGDISNSENYSSVWTEAETLLLLESVLKHGDDWDLVAENVKTKNKADCISKLIQLPFGDLMLGSAYGRGQLLDNVSNPSSVQITLSEPNPIENMKTGYQISNVENEKRNGNAETEKQNDNAESKKNENTESKEIENTESKEIENAEIETKENGNAEIESKENQSSEIESKENENAEIESKENENAEIESKENENAEIESKENGNAENESQKNGNAEIGSKENGNAEIGSKENGNAEIESKENGNAEFESKDNGNAEIESKANENVVNKVSPLKRKRINPSSTTSSSLMKQVALLSSVVDPRITACAAEAAISVLCDEIQCPREIFDGNDTEDEELGSSLLENKVPQVDEMDIDGRPTTTEPQETSSEKNDLPLSLQVRAATATALGAAAARAKLLADQEDREIETLVANIIETQMKKVQYKSKYFDDLELMMEKEYNELEDLKESIIVERMNVLQRVFREISGSKEQTLPKS